MGLGKERRRSERLSVNDGMYVVFRPSFTPLGRVVDISEEGIALEYVQIELDSFPLQGLSNKEIDLFTVAGRFYLKRLPCKISYDILHELNQEGLPSTISTRRCGLEFCGLTEVQKVQLEQFVNNKDGKVK